MKTKHIAVIRLVVGLLLVLANDALAFYNPQTGHWLSRDPINEVGFKVLTRNPERFKRNGEKNLYGFVKNSPLTFCDPFGNDTTSTVVGSLFPESWAISGDPAGQAAGWYATHCAAHCWGHSLNRLLNCPLGNGPELEAVWTVAWEIVELSSGEGGWGDEPLYDRLIDAIANAYGAALSTACAGKCRKCDSAIELLARAEIARRCCDKACAAAQPLFMAVAHMMQAITGEEWEE